LKMNIDTNMIWYRKKHLPEKNQYESDTGVCMFKKTKESAHTHTHIT